MRLSQDTAASSLDQGCAGPADAAAEVRKRIDLFRDDAILYQKCIVLPRQARHKHRESTQKESGCVSLQLLREGHSTARRGGAKKRLYFVSSFF